MFMGLKHLAATHHEMVRGRKRFSVAGGSILRTRLTSLIPKGWKCQGAWVIFF